MSRRRWRVVFAVVLGLFITGAVFAQEAVPEAEAQQEGAQAEPEESIQQMSQRVMEEMIVTAQKREQNMRDIGISVTAYSGQQLKDMGVFTTEEIMYQVPNMEISHGLGAFEIRGVANNYGPAHAESPNSVYVDESYLSHRHVALFQLYDMERTEVLRGPQGTLFSRNATGCQDRVAADSTG